MANVTYWRAARLPRDLGQGVNAAAFAGSQRRPSFSLSLRSATTSVTHVTHDASTPGKLGGRCWSGSRLSARPPRFLNRRADEDDGVLVEPLAIGPRDFRELRVHRRVRVVI